MHALLVQRHGMEQFGIPGILDLVQEMKLTKVNMVSQT